MCSQPTLGRRHPGGRDYSVLEDQEESDRQNGTEYREAWQSRRPCHVLESGGQSIQGMENDKAGEVFSMAGIQTSLPQLSLKVKETPQVPVFPKQKPKHSSDLFLI
jgi:hypothetical protein